MEPASRLVHIEACNSHERPARRLVTGALSEIDKCAGDVGQAHASLLAWLMAALSIPMANTRVKAVQADIAHGTQNRTELAKIAEAGSNSQASSL